MAAKDKSPLVEPPLAIAELEAELARRTAERDEALARESAIAEVLEVVNSPRGDLAPVFNAMVEKALWLCAAKLGLLLAYEGGCYCVVSLRGAPPAFVEFASRGPITPGPDTGLARLARDLQVVHIEDLVAGEAYRLREPLRVASVELAGMRTFLAVPLIKDAT